MLKTISLFFICCLLNIAPSKAQSKQNEKISTAELKKYFGIPSVDSLMHQSDEDAQKFLFTPFYTYKLGVSGVDSLFIFCQKIIDFAKANGNKQLELQFELFDIFNHPQQVFNKEALLANTKKIHQKAKDENIKWAINVSKFYLALNYLTVQQDYPNGSLLLRETLDDIEKDNHFNSDLIRNPLLSALINYHYLMGDYQSVIFFGRQALNRELNINTALEKNAAAFIHIVNTLGNAYRNLNVLDTSNYYFNRIFQWAIQKNDSVWIALCNGNLGENFYLQKEYDLALPMLQIDADYEYAKSDLGPASNAYLLMANTYLEKGDIQHAENYLKKGTECLRKYIQPSTIEKCRRLKLLYQTLTRYYIATKNTPLAQMYFDSSQIFTDSVVKMRSMITSVNTEGIFQLQKSEIKELKLTNDLIASQKKLYLIFASLIIVILSTAIGFNQYRSMAKLKHTRLKLEKEKVEEDFAAAREELKKYILQFASMPLPIEQDVDWKQSTILTQEHWQKFQELLCKSYPEFINRVYEQMPDLTETELRFLCLLKVKLNDTEMANVLGVNKNTIQQTRSRLRKKLNLDGNVSFTDLVEQI